MCTKTHRYNIDIERFPYKYFLIVMFCKCIFCYLKCLQLIWIKIEEELWSYDFKDITIMDRDQYCFTGSMAFKQSFVEFYTIQNMQITMIINCTP